MYPHRIRLRGPWECQPSNPAEPARSATRWRRWFGRPSRLDAHETVWLTFTGVAATAAVSLNGRDLGRGKGDFEFDVTPHLRPRNELLVDVDSHAGVPGIRGEVALEVRCAAFLKDVRAWRTANGGGSRVRVAGTLVGTSDRPLELYAILARTTVLYAALSPTPAGTAFDVAGEILPPDQFPAESRVRVELVNGATVWHVADAPLCGRKGQTPGPQGGKRPGPGADGPTGLIAAACTAWGRPAAAGPGAAAWPAAAPPA